MTGRTPSRGLRRPVAVLAALLLVGATAACYSYSGARYGGPDAPLQARIASAHGGRTSLSFAVSDRAHVALFRIEDSGHVRALYPYHPGSSAVFAPGGHTVLASRPSFRRRLWAPAAGFATYRRAPRTCAAGFGHVSTSYLMIVASRRPLRMERIRGEVPFRYRPVSALSIPFRRGTAFGTMDRLLARLVPAGVPRDDWDVDWVVATDFGSPWCRRIRPPIPRRIAEADPPAEDTTSTETRRRQLDSDDLPFTPPRIPIDLPEVASVDGSDGTARVRVPLPPVDVTPVPRVSPGDRDEEIAVEGLDGLERERRRPWPARWEVPERRPREAGPESAPAPSEHFGRLFGEDDRRNAEGWIPGWTGDRGRTAERRLRRWPRDLTRWVDHPNRNEFPAPRRPPARWRDGTDLQGGARGFDRPAHRTGVPGDIGGARPIVPPAVQDRGRDIEVRRPSRPDRGGDSGARDSGGNASGDRSGG